MWGIRKTSWDGPDSRVVFALDFWTSVRCLVSSCLRDDPSTTSMLFYTMISIWFFDLKLLFALSKYFHNFHLRSLDSFFSFGPQEYWMSVTRLFMVGSFLAILRGKCVVSRWRIRIWKWRRQEEMTQSWWRRRRHGHVTFAQMTHVQIPKEGRVGLWLSW